MPLSLGVIGHVITATAMAVQNFLQLALGENQHAIRPHSRENITIFQI